MDATADKDRITGELRDRYGVLMSAEDVADLLGATATSVLVRARQPRTDADRALARARIRLGRRVYWRPDAIAGMIAAAAAVAEEAAV